MKANRLRLFRQSFKEGSYGSLFLNHDFLCFIIELPWLDNQRNVSCIPAGTYELVQRSSARFSQHLYVKQVPQRSMILIHPANDASTQLQGCLAPVMQLSGLGKGWNSRQALNLILSRLKPFFDSGNNVYLDIISTDSSQYFSS